MSATAIAGTRRTQSERSAAMQQRLVAAATRSLIEHGFARTTVVEICRRAEVTRGAFHHHFAGLSALLVAVLEDLYRTLTARDRKAAPRTLEGFIRRAWERTRRPEFKAVIEIWLAARNDTDLGRDLAPAIARLSRLFDPLRNAALAETVGSDREARAFYRLVSEALIGLALGRAVSRSGRPVAHEREVIDLLTSLARARATQQVRRHGAPTRGTPTP